MKRSVAIFGPTPQFVRWAIWHPCQLRDPDSANLPDITFRQLRGLREFSIGLIEDRVFEGICVHPDATSDRAANAMGFAGHEVLDAHGNEAIVANCCGRCPANALQEHRPGIWAGCYGWLPGTSSFCFETTLKSTNTSKDVSDSRETGESDFDVVQLLDESIDESNKAAQIDDLFMKTSPRWYGIWADSILSGNRINLLLEVFDQIVLRSASAIDHPSNMSTDLVSFRDALQRCAKHDLNMHVELIPPGYSDGQTWTLADHCPDCKSEMPEGKRQKTCPACGRNGSPHGARKSKVLGLRPYVQLAGIMGESKTAEFLRRYESRR